MPPLTFSLHISLYPWFSPFGGHKIFSESAWSTGAYLHGGGKHANKIFLSAWQVPRPPCAAGTVLSFVTFQAQNCTSFTRAPQNPGPPHRWLPRASFIPSSGNVHPISTPSTPQHVCCDYHSPQGLSFSRALLRAHMEAIAWCWSHTLCSFGFLLC